MTLTVTSLVFAEDVRREASGKDLIIGAFGGDIILPMIPSMLQISIWVSLSYDGSGPTSGDIELSFPNDAPKPAIIHFEQDIPTAGSALAIPPTDSALSTPTIATDVSHEGDLIVRFRESGGEFLEIGRKHIILQKQAVHHQQ